MTNRIYKPAGAAMAFQPTARRALVWVALSLCLLARGSVEIPSQSGTSSLVGRLRTPPSERALDAEEGLRAALSHDRGDLYALNELAQLVMRRGAYEEACSLVRRVLTMVPHDGRALDTLGVCSANTVRQRVSAPRRRWARGACR
jgi:hypothetical protein